MYYIKINKLKNIKEEMSFMEKYNIRNKKIDIIPPEEQSSLYEKTFRCPQCFKVPLLNLNFDLDSILSVKVTCECGQKNLK